MRKKTVVLLILVTLLATLITACSKTADTKTEKIDAGQGKREVRIAYQPDSTVVKVAKAKGWYEEEFSKDGTEVKYSLFLSGPPIIEAFAGNRQDIGVIGDMPPVSARSSGVDLKFISRSGVVPFNNAIVVSVDSTISSVQDLKGKKVAVQVGSSAHHLLILALQKSGLSMNDVNVVNLPTPDQLTALETKNVDAIVTWEPWVASLENAQKGKVLIDQTGIKRHISGYIIRNEFGAKNHDLVERFLKVNQRAVEYIKQNPDEVLNILAQDLKLPVPALAKSFKATDWDPKIFDEDIKGFIKVKEFLKEQNVLKKDFDINDLIDRSYLKNIGVQ